MKIVLCVVGKTTTGYVKEGVEEYASRVRRFLPFDLKIIPDTGSKRSRRSPDPIAGSLF